MVYLVMANAVNAEDLATSAGRTSLPRRRPTCVLNHKLKLPPILPTTHLIPNKAYLEQQQKQQLADITSSVSLPRLDFASLAAQHSKQSENKRTSKQLDYPTLPRVYDVLPPIGQTKLKPAPPLGLHKSNHLERSPTDTSKRRRTTRHHRTNKAALTKSSADAEQSVDEQKPTGSINGTTRTEGNLKSTVSRVDIPAEGIERVRVPLVPDESCTLDGVTKSSSTNCVKFLVEDEPDDIFLHFNTIPKALQPYGDVYPPSPPPYDRRARNTVERMREELKAENRIRVSYIRNYGECRRNATCVELDDVLRNASEVLREVFLRKTMEELCMLW